MKPASFLSKSFIIFLLLLLFSPLMAQEPLLCMGAHWTEDDANLMMKEFASKWDDRGSWEERAQVRRLEYLLSNGVKELLVDRVAEWPGVHSAEALVEGKTLVGHWYDRTKEGAARRLKGKVVDPEDFATEEHLVLSPIPCWEHLPPPTLRRRVAEIVARIDEEGARERQRTGRRSLGVKKILRVRPHKRPRRVEKSPKPRFHAATKKVLKQLRDAHAEVVAAFRAASARLLAGEVDVVFPEGTFPPGLPFVPFASRGHPA